MKASDFPKSRILNAKDLARQIVEGNRNGRRYCFILGSGSSAESKIPTGFELEMAWMHYLMGQGKDKYDYQVKSEYGGQAEALLSSHTREETERLANCLYEDVDEKGKRKLSHSFQEIEEAWNEARENKTGPWTYNFSEFYFDIYRLRFHDNDEDGYRYLERIMERSSPSIGYHPFSLLLANSGRNNLVVTTNFDTLVEDSLALYTNQKPLVISHESLAGFLSSELSRPMIAKVHRGLFYDPMNSPDLALAEEWKDKLNHLLAIYTPIVVGYGGGDHSLMSFLEECKSLKRLYWCVRGELDQLPERIVDAVASKKEGRLVKIKGFDALMLELGKVILGADCLTPTTVQAHFQEQMNSRVSAYAKRWNELNGEQKPDLKEELTEIRAAEKSEEEEREKEGKLTAWDYFQRGYAADEAKQWDAAIEAYTKAIELQPDYAAAYNNRGSAYDELGKYDEAIRDYDRAIELQPDDPMAYNNRGSAYGELGKYDEAIRDYDRAIELRPDDPKAYNNRGLTYAEMGEYEKALADLQHALELAPEHPAILHSLGFAYMKRGEAGDRERALELFHKAISIDPSLPDAYEDRAKLYREMGKLELAEQDEAQARELREKE